MGAEFKTNIKKSIQAWCARQPSAPALISSLRAPLLYRDLVCEIEAFRQTLRLSGLDSEARIGIALPKGPDYILSLIGTICNSVAVPLNPDTPAGELARNWSQLGLDAIVCLHGHDTAVRMIAERSRTPILEARCGNGQFVAAAPGAKPILGDGGEPGPDSIAFIVQTSGTTGEPKLIPSLHRNMLAAAERQQSWYGLAPSDRCLSVVAPYYSHAITVTILPSLLTGGSIAVPASADHFDSTEWFGALQPTWYSASPTMHRLILDGACASTLDTRYGLRFVLSGGAPLPEHLRADLTYALGAPVLEHYGCSEASLIASNVPHASRAGTCGRAWPGTVRIVKADGSEADIGECGRIVLGGPTLAPGYISANEAHRGAFVAGWLYTEDIGSIDSDGFLALRGRVSEIINRGGEKFSPYEVEAALLRHPDVAEAVAFGVSHPRLGEEVMGAVVIRPGTQVEPQHLRQFLLGEIAGFKIPRRIELVASIPKSASGKISRKALADTYRPPAKRQSSDPRQIALLAIWRKLLNDDTVGLDDDFFLAGGDSLLAAAALVAIERKLGRAVPVSLLFESATVRGVLAGLNRIGSKISDDVVRVGSGNGQRPLFFFHGQDEGCVPYFLLRLSRLLGSESALIGIPPHGLRGEPVPPTVEAMAADRARMIIREQTVGPYRIGGFCNGAIVAYETARKLQSEGRELDLLILIDAPSWSFRPGVRTLLGCLRHLSVDVQAWGWFSRLEKAVSVAEKLRWAARGFLRRWRSVKATPSEMVSLIRRAEALARYRPQPMQVRAVYYAGDYAGSGWRQLLSGLQIVPIPGGHCGVLGEHIDLLATDLRIRLTG